MFPGFLCFVDFFSSSFCSYFFVYVGVAVVFLFTGFFYLLWFYGYCGFCSFFGFHFLVHFSGVFCGERGFLSFLVLDVAAYF